MQPQAQVTELVNMIDLGMNVQAAADAARFSHDQASNVLDLEPELFDLVGTDLAAKGHEVRSAPGGDLVAGGYQGIHFTPEPGLERPRASDKRTPVNGVYRGGSDHRKDGAAVGW